MGFFSKRAPTDAELACSFCGSSRLAVKTLIQGPSVWICDNCIGLCNDLVAKGENAVELDAISASRDTLVKELGRLTQPFPKAVTRKLLEALLVLSDDAVRCREVAGWALVADDDDMVLAAFSKIAPSEMGTWDRINVAVLYDDRGDPERGLLELAAVDRETMPKDAQVLLPLYEASLRLAAGIAHSSEAAELLALTTSVATLLPTLDLTDDFRRRVVRQAKITEAGALRLQGDTNGALAVLRALTDAHEEDAHVWSLIHDVHVGRGEHGRAKEAREKALAHAKSDGHTARKLGPRPQPFR